MELTVASFNVNGIRARLDIVLDWLKQVEPQVLCLQETKVQDKDFPAKAFDDAGWQVNFLGQKSYNGVAIVSRVEPEEIVAGFPDGWSSDQARLIMGRFAGVWVVNTYVPQGRDVEDPAFAYKLEFFGRLRELMAGRFSPRDKLVWVGDLNVAPGPLDVFDPKRMQGKVCFHPKEHEALAKVMDWGLEDMFRKLHPADKQFTFWDYRLPGALKRDLGWRIDHVMATAPLAGLCRDCWVDTAPRALTKPSDHTPVLARFDLGQG